MATGRNNPFGEGRPQRVSFDTWQGMWLDRVAPGIGEWDSALFEVAFVIVHAVNPKSLSATISFTEIGAQAQCSEQVVRRCVRDLERAGYLIVDRGNGRGIKSMFMPQLRGNWRVVEG